MGNYMNKLLFHADESRKENEAQTTEQPQVAKEDNKLCTPTCSKEKLLVDPRSASLGIKRTPILVDSTPVEVNKKIPNVIPKHLQKKYLETNLDTVIPPWSPKKHFMARWTANNPSQELEKVQISLMLDNVTKTPKNLTVIEKERYKILGLDPRSPAADFNRTPILIPKSLALIKARSQDNLSRNGSYETDVYNSRNSWQETSISLDNTEIQLLPDIASKRLKELDSETQAELNILDIHESNSDDSDSSVFVSEEDITVIKNTEFKVTNDRSLVTDERTYTTIDKREDSADKQKDIDHKDVVEQNMRAMQIKDDNKIKIWHDSSASEKNTSSKMEEREVQENIEGKLFREEILKGNIIHDEYPANNTSPSESIKIENIQKREDVEGNVKKIPRTDIQLKSDEKKIYSPDSKYSNEVSKNRTPLGNRSNNDKTQGIPTKSPQQLLKNKTLATIVQQENTPPYKSYNAKTRNGTQWDPNSSVII